jgi:hypothetical protein
VALARTKAAPTAGDSRAGSVVQRVSAAWKQELVMATSGWQTWNSGPFSIQRKPGKSPGTVILCFCGPFTIRDAYSSLPPGELNRILGLEPAPGEEPPKLNILDLSACPYMDSSGLGIIATHYVRCQKQGLKFMVAGLSPDEAESN